MLLTLSLAFVLSAPTDVLEEFELLSEGPLREVVTARATYARRDGVALLPGCVQGREMPTVQAFGHGPLLRVARGARGWVAWVPDRGGDSVRLVARVIRPAPTPRLFSLRWPLTTAVSARRVVTLPRDYVRQEPPGWTCPEPIDHATMSCVSTLAAPPGFPLSFPAPKGPRGLWAVAAIVNLAAWRNLTARAAGLEPLLCAGVGVLVGLSLSLALVGALCASWSACAVTVLPASALVGALAPRHPASRWIGTLGAMVIPLLATTYGGVGAVLLAVCACATVVLVGAMMPPRAQPPSDAPSGV